MLMIMMYWTGKKMLKFDNSNMLEIRKRVLYLLITWENLKADLSLIGYKEGKALCN